MRKSVPTLINLLNICIICSIFAPLFLINGTYYEIFNLTFAGNFAANLIFVFLLVLILLAILLTYILNNKLALFLLDFASSVGLIISIQVISEYINANVEVGPGFISLLLLFITKMIYEMQFVNDFKIASRDIVEIALFVSFAIALDLPFCKIKIFPNGGSISITMIPLIFISSKKGLMKGFVASGIAYGIITCLLDGYGFVTYPLDYLFGYGSIALVGVFKKQIFQKSLQKSAGFFTIGVLLAFLLRTIFSTISGILIYQLDFLSSLIYQLTYLGPSAVACLVLGLLLLPLFKKIMKKYPEY